MGETSGPVFSSQEYRQESESSDHQGNVTTGSCIRYYDTGDGYLPIMVRLEYHPEIDRWFPIENELLDISTVEDQSVIRDVLAELGTSRQSVKHLPLVTLDHLQRSGRCNEGESPKKTIFGVGV